jgi:hypothetical protein
MPPRPLRYNPRRFRSKDLEEENMTGWHRKENRSGSILHTPAVMENIGAEQSGRETKMLINGQVRPVMAPLPRSAAQRRGAAAGARRNGAFDGVRERVRPCRVAGARGAGLR